MPNPIFYLIPIGIAVAVAVRQWQAKPDASLLHRTGYALLPAVVTGIAAFAASFVLHAYNRDNTIDKTVSQLEKMPLVGVILQDQPQYRERIRAAVRANDGSARALLIEMRGKFAGPAIWAAPEAEISVALAGEAKFRDYLATQSNRLCSEFMMTGIQNLNDLSPLGRQMFDDGLRNMERIYSDGKGKAPAAQPPNHQQTSDFYRLVGFTQDEINALHNKGSDALRCSAGQKIYAAIDKLKPEYRGLFSRYLLSLAGS